MRITLIESPFANLDSISRALRKVGGDVALTRDPEVVAGARKIVVPGVGSFAAAMNWMLESGVGEAVRQAVDSSAWLLGVCVGHQILFESSDELGQTAGLGLIPGRVRRFPDDVVVPKIGWNRVALSDDPLFEGLGEWGSFYFVHSYRAEGLPPNQSIAEADYGGTYCAAARSGRVAGVQFHPEKSSRDGLRVLENFVRAS